MLFYYIIYLISKSEISLYFDIENGLKLAYRILIILCFFVIFLNSKLLKSVYIKNKTICNFSLLSIFLSIILAIINDTILTIQNLIYIITPLIIPIVVLSISEISNFNMILRFKNYLILSLILIIFVSIFLGGDIFITTQYYGEFRDRLVLGFIKPSYLCELLYIISILCFLEFKYFNRKFSLLTTLICLILIYFTDSRAILFSLLLGIVVYFFFSIRSKKVFERVLFIITGITVFIMSNLYSYLILNDSGRLLIINEAISKNIQNIFDFFIGVGIGNAKRFSDFYQYDSVRSDFFHIDNFYIELLIQGGFFSVLLFFLIIYFFYKKNSNNIISVSLISVSLIYGVFESVIFHIISPFGIIPWLIIAAHTKYFLKKST